MNPIHGVLVDIEAGVTVSNIYRRIGGVPSRHRFVQGLSQVKIPNPCEQERCRKSFKRLRTLLNSLTASSTLHAGDIGIILLNNIVQDGFRFLKISTMP
mmetsp:Transcript_63749/g.170806  ORF Transcript_63749/g.170806 Transcript_63749/m.170806 type:complete len:99 (-) Transcript_63749:510-806(-)